jgi:23S rRNA pseudouridine1911/1915/1917 synthase
MVTIKLMIKEQKNGRSLVYETVYSRETSIPIADFLKQAAPLSGRSLRQSFFKGLIRLNHKKAHSQAKLKNGDSIQIYGVDEERQTIASEAIPLDIVYEDKDLLVINKAAGLAVHPTGNITSGTLANGVAAYFEKSGLKLKVRPVNRLDYGTSGLIIFAKNAAIQTKLSGAIQKSLIKRIYYAVAEGVFKTETGIIDRPIANANGRRIVDSLGQPAVTHYQLLKQYKTGALLKLDLKTGRTHQIRIHLKFIGHPIIGDRQYGNDSLFINRPALHAGELHFDASDFHISKLSAPFPKDFEELLAALGKC